MASLAVTEFSRQPFRYLKDTIHDNCTGMFILAGILAIGALVVLQLPARLVNR